MRQYNVGNPLERIALDIFWPHLELENRSKYILVTIDHFIKCVEESIRHSKPGDRECVDKRIYDVWVGKEHYAEGDLVWL